MIIVYQDKQGRRSNEKVKTLHELEVREIELRSAGYEVVNVIWQGQMGLVVIQ